MDSAMVPQRLTKFPDLTGSRLPPSGAENNYPSKWSWTCDLTDLTREILAASWAIFLQKYTKIEQPAFLLNDRPVYISQPRSSRARVYEVDVPVADDLESTQVYFGEVQIGTIQRALNLSLDIQANSFHLTSSWLVPSSFLKEIAAQFMEGLGEVSGRQSIIPSSKPQLSVLNPHPKLIDGPTTLHELLGHSVDEQKIAIEYHPTDDTPVHLSYVSLHKQADFLSIQILQHYERLLCSTKTHPVIPLLLPQHPNLYISQLAILKCGGAFCPINLDAPIDRIKFIVQDTQAKMLLTTVKLKGQLSDIEPTVKIICVDSPEASLDNPSLPKISSPDPSSPAYVMYTSGSTGKPKGVPISHQAATQALLAHDVHIPPFERFLQFASPTFDVSVFEIFFPLFRGSTLICSDRERLLSDLPKAINEHRIDALELTPTVASTLIQSRQNIPNVKVLLTIGEMLTDRVISEFGAGPENNDGILWAMYGPTEATIHCTLEANMSRKSGVGNIGGPLSTVSAFVVDYSDSPTSGPPQILPIGQIGELAVGGHQLAPGYLNRPEQTKAAFVDLSPYGPVYRTGDKARLLPNGRLECLGRISNTQVKLRGQRIELGEIEATAYRVPGIRLACAAVIDGALVIFCTSSGDVFSEDVTMACQKWLPRFMRPNDVVMLQDVPRLASGKVDRKVLEAEYKNKTHSSERDFEDEVQRQLASVFATELGHPLRQGDNLLAHGLDSLRAITISSKLRSQGFMLKAGELLETPTIEALAGLLSHKECHVPQLSLAATLEAKEKLKEETLKQIVSSGREVHEVDVCTPMQLAMLSETLIDSRLNCNWFEMQFPKSTDDHQLEKAIRAVAHENDILRSGFVFVENMSTFARIIQDQLPVSQFSYVDRFDYGHDREAATSILAPLSCQILRREHRVLFHAHHAIFDGWSLDQMILDFEQVISGESPPPRPQYSLVSQFYAEYTGSTDYLEAQKYWKSTLQGVQVSKFPMLCSKRPASLTISSRQQYSSVPLAKIDEVAKQLGVSRPSIVTAAYALLHGWYTGTDKPLFGVISSGRTLPVAGIERILGPCLTNLPTCIDISQMRTINDLIVQCHRWNREALAHELIPLSEIKGLTNCPADEQLFDTLFVWQESNASQSTTSGKVSIVESQDQLDFAVVLEAEPKGDSLLFKLTTKSAVLPDEHAIIICKQLDVLLESFVQDGTQLLEGCMECFIGKQNLLSSTNLDYQSLSEGTLDLISNLEDMAVEQPQRPALEYVNDIDPRTGSLSSWTVSYSELNNQANRLASYLQSKNFGADDLIAVWMEKSVELYTSILAIIKCGCGFLPLDAAAPSKRALQAMEEAQVKLVMTHSSFGKSHDLPSGVVAADTDRILQGADNHNFKRKKAQGSNLAYAVFTSGTTGKPKGLRVTRRNITSNIDVLTRVYPSCKDAKLLQSCSVAFDVSVFEIFFTWHQGMCLVAARNDVLFRDMEGFIQSTRVTHLSLTPSVARIIQRSKVPNVTFLVIAGEELTPKVFRDWADGKSLYQGYGPAELTNICAAHPKMDQNDFLNNIGPPLANTSAFVVENGSRFRLVPQGCVGELCFGGDQVCRGYINSPQLMKEKFIDHPAFGWLYRTGDIGRMLADGSLQFTGRKDDQVKVRGQRVELAEINQAMIRHNHVADSATLVINDDRISSERLVTFYTSTQISPISTSELLQALSEYLPSYMLPDDLVLVERLPVTMQGKIDKRELKSRYDSGIHDSRKDNNTSERALSTVEKSIAEALADICNIPLSSINPDNRFISLGLDSIKSIGFSRKLRQLGLGQVDVSAIQRHNTVASLAHNISNEPREEALELHSDMFDFLDEHTKSRIANDFAKNHLEIQKILPCTPLQETMLSESTAHENPHYQNKVTVKVRGDIEKLRSSWEVMVQRHEVLRTCFVPTASVDFPFAQVILSHFALPWYDAMSVDGSDGHMVVEEHGLRPPYRLQVRKPKNDNSPSLEITMNHALYDAEAFSILLREVELVFKDRKLAPAPTFDTYLARSLLARQASSLEKWTSILEGFQPHALIDNLESDKAVKSTYASVTRTSRVPWSTVQAASSAISVNVSCVFQASWARLLSFFLSTSDVCFGNVYSGRDAADTESLVAPCFNTLPLRVKMRSHMNNTMLAMSLQERNLELLSLQASSLRLIQANCNLQGRRLFDTLLLIQQPSSSLDEAIWSLESEEGDMPFPLILEIVPLEESDSLSLSIHGDMAKLPMEFIHAWLETFDDVLHNTITFPKSQCADLSFLVNYHPVLQRYKALPRSKSAEHDQNESEEGSQASKERVFEVKDAISSLLPATPMQEIDAASTIFQLGLDSINAFQLASRLKEKGFSIAAADILDAASIPRIANRMTLISAHALQAELAIDYHEFQDRHKPLLCHRLGIVQDEIESIRPCTNAQSGMLAQFINSKGKAYLNTIEYETSADVATTHSVWEKAIEMHEMLRTGFVPTDDQDHPFAMITFHPNAYNLPVAENIEIGPEESAIQVKGTMHKQPWRIYIKPGRVQLMMLHAMYDAQSLQTLLSTLDGSNSTNSLASCAMQPLIDHLLKADQEGEQSKPFWEAYSGTIQPSKFPNLHTRTDHNDRMERLVVPAKLTMREILAGCKRNAITLQVAGQAAWAKVMSAYSGETNVTFGAVLSTRPSQTEMRSVIFPCVNTLPVSANVALGKQDLLQSLSKHNAELLRHPNTSLSNIQRWVKIEQPLFDTVFVYQKLMDDPVASTPSIQWKDDVGMTEYALSLEMIPHPRGDLEFALTFNTGILPHRQAAMALEQFQSVFLDVISPSTVQDPSPSMSAGLLSIVPAKEERIPSPVQYLHEFVEKKTLKSPNKVALEFVDKIHEVQSSKRTWSYTQLNSEGNKFANLLRSHGSRSGELVGVCFDKCPEASFAILGILKAGCAFVALDPGAPVARKEYIIRDANCRFIMTTADKAESFAHLSDVDIIVADDQAALSQFNGEAPHIQTNSTPSDVCYCLYTSGTTGNPKGCLISHDNAVQAMLFFQRIFDGHWNEQSRWLQFASFHFDVSVMEQYLTWSLGMCMVSTPRDVLLEDLAGNISKLGITHIDLTPSLARLVTPEEVPSLCKGVFITGGEALRKEVLDAWGDYAVIYNGYGPSEVTIGCTMHPRVTRSVKPSNIGPQFDNVGSYVMAPGTDKPVLRGAIGELCLTGPLVGIGYLNRPDLSAERFPTIQKTGERMYRTGDLVRLLPDDTFEFIGRIDDQVKLRGQRLEIGEINEVTRQSTSKVKDIATLVLKHPTQKKDQLVSFFTTTDGKGSNEIEPSLDASDLAIARDVRMSIAEKLPPYMIPSIILPISRMPLSSNNKTEAKVLKAIFEGITREDLRKLTDSSSSPSGGNVEAISKIQQCLTETLNIHPDEVQPSSSFFELGLDSISAINLARRLKNNGLTEVHPSMIMKYSTVAGLANALKASSGNTLEIEAGVKASKQRIMAFAHKHTAAAAKALGIRSFDVEAIAPVTALQAGMISKTMQSEHAVYHSTFEFDLRPSIDLNRLRQAWTNARNHLQILRTRFVPTEDGYAQAVVSAKVEHNFWTVIEGQSGSSSTQVIENWLRRHSTSLDKELWKIHLERTSKSQVLHLSLFHGLYDGISLDCLLDYVGRLYHDDQVEIPSLDFFDALPYGPLCEVPRAKEFWQTQLLPAAPLGLQISPSPKMICVREVIPPSPDLARCRNELKVTDAAIFHACWLLTLFEHFQVLPIHGTIVSGRAIDVEGIESVVGPMFNTLPCYLNMDGVSRLSQLVAKCHDFNASVMPFQHTPLRDIMKWQKRNASYPLFDSLFVFQRENSTEKLADQLWDVRTSNAALDYPLAVEVEQRRDNSYGMTLVADTPSIDHLSAEQLLSNFQTNIKRFIEDPEQKLPETLRNTLHSPSQINGSTDLNTPNFDSVNGEASEEMYEVRKQVARLADIDAHEVDFTSSIFELGLDSIDAIKLSARLKEAGLVISMSSIMQLKTIKDIAGRCSQTQDDTRNPQHLYTIDAKTQARLIQSLGLRTADVSKILPATPLQEGLVSGMVASHFQQYLSHELLEVEGGVDAQRLLASFEVVVRENDILRTRFVEMDDPSSPFTYAQVVMKRQEHGWKSQVLADEADLDQLLARRRNEVMSKGLNQDMFSLVRIRIHSKEFLLISMSHALHDGTSLAMLHHDVAAQYEGSCPQRPRSETFMADSFAQSGDDALDFWRDQLNAMKPSIFPANEDALQSAVSHRIEYSSGFSMSKVLKFCRSENITMQTLGLTCWLLVLAHRLQRLDVTSGLVVSGRTSKEAEDIMFPTMNTVAFRAVIHGTGSEMLHYVQDTSARISEYQHFPLRKVRAAANISERPFDSIFLYQRRPAELSKHRALYRSREVYANTEYPVNVEWEIMDENLVFRTACSNAVFNTHDMEKLLKDLDVVLAHLTKDSSSSILSFDPKEVSICDSLRFSPAEESDEKGVEEINGSNGFDMLPFETSIEEVLSDVANVELETLTSNTSLFEIGLDSISAIKVSSLLRKRSIRLTVSDMMKAVTVRKMAELATELEDVPVNRDHITDDMPVVPSPTLISERLKLGESRIEAILPATAGQAYMLQTWKNAGEDLRYHPSFHYRVHGNLSKTVLESAWTRLCDQVPVLRTTFTTSDDQDHFYQVVLRQVKNAVQWLPHTESDPNENKNLPPVRLLARGDGGDVLLALQIHHALYDAISLPLILAGLQQLCNNDGCNVSFDTNFAPYISSSMGTSTAAVRQQFWTNYLKDPPRSLPPPSNGNDPATRTELYRPTLIPDASALVAKAKSEGVSIQSLFFALYAKLHLRRFSTSTSTNDLVIGIYLASRSHSLPSAPEMDLTNLAAPTFNILPLRITFPANHTLFTVARQIQQDISNITSLAHTGASLRDIHAWTSGHVKLDSFVNFLRLPDGSEALSSSAPAPTTTVKTPNTLSPTEEEEEEDKIITLTPIAPWTTSSERQTRAPSPFFSSPSIRPEHKDPIYNPRTLDIEAALRNGGLDVGIFAPGDILDAAEARDIMEEVREELLGLV